MPPIQATFFLNSRRAWLCLPLLLQRHAVHHPALHSLATLPTTTAATAAAALALCLLQPDGFDGERVVARRHSQVTIGVLFGKRSPRREGVWEAVCELVGSGGRGGGMLRSRSRHVDKHAEDRREGSLSHGRTGNERHATNCLSMGLKRLGLHGRTGKETHATMPFYEATEATEVTKIRPSVKTCDCCEATGLSTHETTPHRTVL